MFRVQEWAEVHRLFHREKCSKAEIGDRLGMSRTTVYRLLALTEPPTYERGHRPSLLDPHKARIAELLFDDAEAPATVIIDHLRREGYRGGITILKDHLQRVRPEFLIAQGRQRTSYLPGGIGQGDWWELPLEVPVGKNRTRRPYGFVTTLPHSAAHAVVFSFHKTMPDFLEGCVGCLKRLGGVPDKLVLDNDSSIGGEGVRAARRPHRAGAQRCGVGEAPLDDLQTQFDSWTNEIAFARHHRRVGARVADALNIERSFLHALPDPAPHTDRHLEVRVSKDCFIRVADVDYSVPPQLVGRRVAVRMSSRELAVHLDGKRSPVTPAATSLQTSSWTRFTPGRCGCRARQGSGFGQEMWRSRFRICPATTRSPA